MTRLLTDKMFSTTKTFDHRKFNLFSNFLHHEFEHSMNWCPIRGHPYLKVRKKILQSHHNHSRKPRLSKMDWANQYPSIISFLKLNKQKIGNQKKMEAMDPRKQGLKIIVESTTEAQLNGPPLLFSQKHFTCKLKVGNFA